MADTKSSSTKDVIEAVLEDHARFRALFAELDTAAGQERESTR